MNKNIHSAETVVNYDITIFIANGIVCENERTFIKENCGYIDLTTLCVYTQSPETYSKFLLVYWKKLASLYQQIDQFSLHNIPDDLIISIDQTPLQFFLVSYYIWHRNEIHQYRSAISQIIGISLVCLLLIYYSSMSGGFLSIQLIYQWPLSSKVYFPKEFCVTHTPSHWSIEEKSEALVTKILVPYVKNKVNDLKLRKSQEWLLVSDVFKGHWIDEIIGVI